jgi:hypothetical protein
MVESTLVLGDFLEAGDLEALMVFDGVDKLGCLQK